MTKTNAGFTLIELLITISIAAIVLGLGMPSFQELTRNNRLTAQANDLVGALNLARAEAIKRRATVSVCTSSDQATCTGSTWQGGWIVIDETANELIQVYSAMKGSTTVASTVTEVNYGGNGFLQGGGGATLTLCAGTGKPGREVAVTATGRPSNATPYPTC
jgi:type IV fimbrial biogenesis protein FimT